MRICKIFAPALALLGAGAPLGAQTPPADPLYHVEIIVFAYTNPNRDEEDFRHGREQSQPAPSPRLYPFPLLELESLSGFGTSQPGFGGEAAAPSANPQGAAADTAPIPPAGDGLELIEPADGTAASAERAPVGTGPLPDGFRILRPDELALAPEAARLRNRAAYRVLGHSGWAQTGIEPERTVTLDLKHLGITNPAGTIKVWVTRFRHVAVDLEYFDGSGSYWTAGPEPGLAPLEYAQSYRLQAEENDLRELRYIDHPLFGVLILITPAPVPVAEPDAGPDGGPAA